MTTRNGLSASGRPLVRSLGRQGGGVAPCLTALVVGLALVSPLAAAEGEERATKPGDEQGTAHRDLPPGEVPLPPPGQPLGWDGERAHEAGLRAIDLLSRRAPELVIAGELVKAKGFKRRSGTVGAWRSIDDANATWVLAGARHEESAGAVGDVQRLELGWSREPPGQRDTPYRLWLVGLLSHSEGPYSPGAIAGGQLLRGLFSLGLQGSFQEPWIDSAPVIARDGRYNEMAATGSLILTTRLVFSAQADVRQYRLAADDTWPGADAGERWNTVLRLDWEVLRRSGAAPRGFLNPTLRNEDPILDRTVLWGQYTHYVHTDQPQNVGLIPESHEWRSGLGWNHAWNPRLGTVVEGFLGGDPARQIPAFDLRGIRTRLDGATTDRLRLWVQWSWDQNLPINGSTSGVAQTYAVGLNLHW
jgi:hypothetical protein